MDFAVILPVYNEAGTLQKVLNRLLGVPGARLVVVDDGSTDATREILKKHDACHVIRHEKNEGYGASLWDGFRFARKQGFSFCITMDSDEQHEPDYIPCFLQKLENADVVSGSRYLDPSLWRSEPPPDRWEINRLITERLCRITGFSLTDGFCGFKGYRTEIFEKMTLTEKGYAFPVQFWIQAAKARLRVVECAVPLIYRDYSRNFHRQYVGKEDRLRHYLEVLEREARAAGLLS